MYVQEQIFQIVLVLISFFDALINTGDLVGGFVAGKSTKLIPLPDHYCTDSGSESHHQHLKAALVSKIFCIHFFLQWEVETLWSFLFRSMLCRIN